MLPFLIKTSETLTGFEPGTLALESDLISATPRATPSLGQTEAITNKRNSITL